MEPVGRIRALTAGSDSGFRSRLAYLGCASPETRFRYELMASHLKHLAGRYGLLVLPTAFSRPVFRKSKALDYSCDAGHRLPCIERST